MNKFSKSSQSKNSKLLQLLSRRQSSQLLPINENNWPGLRRPSFASTIKIRNYSSATNRQSNYRQKRQNYQNQSKYKFTNGNIIKSHSVCNINSLNFYNNDDSKSKQFQLSNKKHENRTNRQSNKKFQKSISKKNQNSLEKINSQNLKGKVQKLDDYVIDYFAFNYIGKVIDNPELWQRYVHKKMIIK